MTTIDLKVVVAGARQAARELRGVEDGTDGIGRAFNRVGGLGRGFTSTMEKVGKVGLGAVGVGALGAAAAVGGIGVAFAGVVKTSLGSLARIEQINAQTQSAITSTGGAAQVTSQHIQDLTGSLENQTATEAESIQQGANLLLTFTNIKNGVGQGNDIFDQATKTITDMSRAMDTTGGAVIDTTGTAIQLGKALNDPIKGITALSKVGVSFSEEQKDMIKSMVKNNDTMGAQKIILNELQKEFGGSGEAFAKTSKGQIELAGHAWGTLGEAMSTALLPAIGSVSGGMAALFNQLAEEQAPKLEGVFTKLGTKVSDFAFGATEALGYLSYNMDDVVKNLQTAASGGGTAGLTHNIGEALGLSDSTRDSISPVLDSIFAKGIQVKGVLVDAFDSIRSIPISPLNLLNDALTWAAANGEAFKTVLKTLVITYLVVKGATVAYTVATGAATAYTAANTAATWLNNTAKKASGSYLATWIGVKALELGAWVRTTAATVASTVAMAAHKVAYGVGYLTTWVGVKALEFAGWVRTTAATAASTVAMLASNAATLAMSAATKVAAAGQWLLNAALTANPIGLVIAAIALLVGGVILAYQKSETFRGVVDTVWQALKTAGKWVFDLWLKFSPLGIIITQVKNHWDDITGAIGKFVDKIKDAWNWVKKLADRIADSAIGGALLDAGGAIGGFFGGGRATGGPIKAGGTYLVGEQGPEVITTGASGFVHTAQQTAQMMAPAPTLLSAPAAPTLFSAEEEATLAGLDFNPTFEVWIDGRQMTDAVVRVVEKRKARQ